MRRPRRSSTPPTFPPCVGAPTLIAVNLLVVGVALFVLVRLLARMQRPEPEQAPTPDPDDVVLLREIRDLLRAR